VKIFVELESYSAAWRVSSLLDSSEKRVVSVLVALIRSDSAAWRVMVIQSVKNFLLLSLVQLLCA
jgi:hypothetical protein